MTVETTNLVPAAIKTLVAAVKIMFTLFTTNFTVVWKYYVVPGFQFRL